MTEHEFDLLDSSRYRHETSRLACQILVTETLAGLRITIAPED
jgi:2Fe-2S ferredoxin